VATKANKFLVGLFVLLGLALAIGTFIWLGASKYLQKTNTYLTYFNESVSGLEKDAPVKYRGVTVGRVNDIRVAPDGKLVEVELSIRRKLDVTDDLRARLSTAGLTGWKLVELDQKRPYLEKRTLAPEYETPYPVIRSEPSEYKEILETLAGLVDHIMQLDLAGISESIKSTTKSVGLLFKDEKWQPILDGIDSTVSAMNRAAVSLEKTVSNPDVNKAVADARDLLVEGRKLLADTRKELKALKLETRIDQASNQMNSLSKDVQTLASDLDQRTARLYKELALTTRELQQAAESLKLLMEELRSQPSSLIFSRPPEPRRIEEGAP
jgi:phospholipid/cholesterol/gamma-HCH transport system substrate-binding protein